MFRAWGADVVNMSVATEAALANEAGIPYAAVAMSTDYDCWKTDEAHVTLEMILANLHRNAEQAKNIVRRALPLIARQGACSCHNALKSAILTDRKFWPQKTKSKLKAILGKYL